MSVETTTICDKCGDVIGQHSSHWTATFSERHDPNQPVPAVYLHPEPTRLDICGECTQEVLGPLLRNAHREPEPSPIQALIWKARDQVGYFVPAGTDICPHCGDQNFDENRMCISCNHGHPGHDADDCKHFCRNAPNGS